MNRRFFLFGSAAVIGAVPSLVSGQPLGFQNRVTCLVITDITPDVSVAHLLALFDALSNKGLPFSCVVDPLWADGQPLKPEDRLSTLLSGYSLQGHGFDVVPFVPDLSKQSAYFQARRVRETNAILRNILTAVSDRQSSQSMLKVVACDDVDSPKSPTGVRSAGVNTVIALPNVERPVSSETWPNGVVRLYGGRKIDLRTYSRAELKTDAEVTQMIFHISAADLQTQSVEVISARASELAKDLLATENTGRNTVQLLSDLQLRDSYGFQRYVAVHLLRPDPENQRAKTAFDAFLNTLKEQGIIASVGDMPDPFKTDRKTDYWLPVAAQTAGLPANLELIQVKRSCRTDPARLHVARQTPLPAGHKLAFGDPHTQTPGFDGCAVLWLPCLDIATPEAAAGFTSRLGRTNDIVISIRPEALSHQFARTSLMNQLLALASDGVTQLVPVQFLGQMIAPQGAEIERQRRTIASLPRTRSRSARATDARRQALMEDAKIAWGYFEKNTIRKTGLCPATLNFSATDGRVHPTVTMWDVGSHINALVAAVQLGLLGKEQFERSISQILTQVRGRQSQGRLLPQGWLRVDRQKWGNKDFDGSDAGRLLASLENLRRSFGMKDRLSALVESWDLDKIVIEGEVHSVTDGKLQSVYRSHSAHYAARAFRYWGVDAASPYEVFQGRSEYDDQMALLEVVSWIGPLGAEPLLLEALELGMSKESAYLAEVLFAAQLEDHEETGRLISVSEGPIDRPPWFTYQGLQMDAVERTWALDTVGYEPQYAEREFWRENLVVSSKSAFLWAAYKPHAYSDKLLKYVREKARTNRGFASSIFSKTGRVTSTYTDLNTNAVILQAISKTLNDS